MLLYSTKLSEATGVRHFVSTKKGGYSQAPFASCNVSKLVGDEEQAVIQNREYLRDAIGAEHLVIPMQTHSDRFAWVNRTNALGSFPETDALLCKEEGIAIAVMSADCVPILFFDTQARMVAAVHAGWRGTCAGIVGKVLQAMWEAGARPESTLAYIGPSISQKEYEVGPEVIQAFQHFPAPERILESKPTGKALCNLWEANLQIMLEHGIPGKNIEQSGICTASRTDLFYSARKEKPQTGRFAAGIMLL
ncbi:MAG: peptidoglycan editing factor PgeF [Cytophagaceae bacterium]|nr:peptidoglycan editing factor PgeF [Cytophagaceae bacterium]